MKYKFNFSTIRFRIWLSSFLILVLVLFFVYFFQVFFYSNNYRPMRKNEMEKLGEQIKKEYVNLASEDNKEFYAYLRNISASEAISIYVFFDINNKEIINLSSFSLGLDLENISIKYDFFHEISKSIYDSIHYNYQDIAIKQTNFDDYGNEFAYYAACIDTDRSFLLEGTFEIINSEMYIVLESKIDPVKTDITILNIAISIALFISLILATVITYIVSYRISKPIRNICLQANTLAKGNYDIIFNGGSYDELIELAESLNKMRIELKKTSNLQRKLISNVSHDLRTPLTLIKSYAEMVRDLSYKNDEKRNKHLNVIIDETNRLTNLVNDILDLSKLQSNIDDLTISNFDLSKLIINVISRFDILVSKENFQFILNIEDDIIIDGDKTKIEQAIYNLISNAVNYAGDEKIIIINLSKKDTIKFSVEDKGKGIDEEEIKDIWNRYYRSKDNHKRSTVGTGLGLSIVREIFEAHNFNYGVISKKNEGSTFYFEIKK